jgi:toxin ParE1/3/4
MSSFRYSTKANLDIFKISEYIFELNPPAALKFIEDLNRVCQRLADHPLMGRQRPDLGENVRSFPIGNYLVFYVPENDGIVVARIIYGGRDLPEVF